MARGSENKKLLPQVTAERICDYIAQNKIQPGAKLPNEFQLAEIFNVGRSTVRDAIKILVYEEKVEVVRGSGTYVKQSPEAAEEEAADEIDDPMGMNARRDRLQTALEFFEVRLMIEPEVAALAAANATKADCTKLLAIHENLKADIYAGQDHRQNDVEFHLQIAKCTHNAMLINLMDTITKGIIVIGDVTEWTFVQDTVGFHEKILQSILNGDAIGARCNMIEHLNPIRENLLERYRNR